MVVVNAAGTGEPGVDQAMVDLGERCAGHHEVDRHDPSGELAQA